MIIRAPLTDCTRVAFIRLLTDQDQTNKEGIYMDYIQSGYGHGSKSFKNADMLTTILNVKELPRLNMSTSREGQKRNHSANCTGIA